MPRTYGKRVPVTKRAVDAENQNQPMAYYLLFCSRDQRDQAINRICNPALALYHPFAYLEWCVPDWCQPDNGLAMAFSQVFPGNYGPTMKDDIIAFCQGQGWPVLKSYEKVLSRRSVQKRHYSEPVKLLAMKAAA